MLADYFSSINLSNLNNANFIEKAAFLSRNKSKNKADEILKDIKNFKIIVPDKELILWDNLFYQTVTQKNFYLKEALMQILVFNNFLKEIAKITTSANQILIYETLASARVVLPISIFEAAEIRPIQATANKIEATNSETASTILIENSLTTIATLETANLEVKKLEQNFYLKRQVAYNATFADYTTKNQPVMTAYYTALQVQKKRLYDLSKTATYDINDPSNEKELNCPELPTFNFDYPLIIDDASLSKELSKLSFDILKSSSLTLNNLSYQDLTAKIEDAILDYQKTIVDNTQFSQKVVLVGGFEVSAKQSAPTPTETINPMVQAFVPEKFGVRNIGIADYKKVVSNICHYSAGEVSHIENIMAKELRSKTTTRERIEEVMQTEQTEQEKEVLTDLSTTQRFEMQNEISKLLAEDRQIGAYAKYSNNTFGNFEVGANYATNNSKEESNRQAITQAKDITNRAMERIVTKVRKETVTKITEKFKEENVHAFDNRFGEEHVSGVYRFINAIYDNRVFNYGKRMMYEFMIPQPSKLHVLGLTNAGGIENPVTLNKPIDPRTNGYENFTKIAASNYLELCRVYNAEIVPYLMNSSAQYHTVKEQGGFGVSGFRDWWYDIAIPQGYNITHVTIDLTFDRRGEFDNPRYGNPHANAHGNINIGGQTHYFSDVRNYNKDLSIANPYINAINLYIWTWDIGKIFYNINANFSASSDWIMTWQKQIFANIIAGYEKQLAAYNKQVGEVVVKEDTILASNPGFYRQIEQTVLRKNCISYLMDEQQMGQGFYNGDSLQTYNIIQTKEMDNYASFVKFIEQSFDWSNMSYNFYPFYWGERQDWKQLYQFENNDPLFRSFMQAGMARVVVTVKPGFENAVMHYMATGQIWNGGEMPVISNPLYLSIVDEIKQQEYTVEETWKTVVPTSLIGLQSSGVSVKGEGLPFDPTCTDARDLNLLNNSVKLNAVKPV